MDKLKALFKNRTFIRIISAVSGSIIYSFAVIFVLDKGKFYASGITGMSQILANDILKMPLLKSVFIGCLNAPLFIMGWKHLSKNFAIYSLACIILQVIFTYVFELAYDAGFDPFKNIVFNVTVDDKTYQSGTAILAIIGGVLCGVGSALPLRVGVSVGGTDILSQIFAFEKGMPFGIISGLLDGIIIAVGTIINGDISIAVYTIIRLIVTIVTIDKIHTVYNYQKISIITQHYDEIRQALIEAFPHGVTIFKATGGYTNADKWVLESVVFTYELEQYRTIIKNIDPHAFVYYTSIKGIMGKFVRRAIQ